MEDLAAVEEFFHSLEWGGAIYGWRFFDEPELTSDWPAEPSLSVHLRDRPPHHTFYWFNECGMGRGGTTESYCLEGTIGFTDLLVLDAMETEIPLEAFVADGVRHWDAFFVKDERVSIEAQHAAQREALVWRAWSTGTSSTMGTL